MEKEILSFYQSVCEYFNKKTFLMRNVFQEMQ